MQQIDRRIAFLGSGNMASALIQGLLASGTSKPERIVASDVRAEALDALRTAHGIETTQDNARACGADVIVLSVKPQVLPALLAEIAPHVKESALVISIAAGAPLAMIESQLSGRRVVRAMPNTPALVGAGATAIAPGQHAGNDDLALARRIFESVGTVVDTPESLLDAVTALSGSGPAYLFYLAEALVDAGEAVGLPAHVAQELALQTVYGAAKLLHESSEAPAELRRKVTSPGGTTQAGVAKLDELKVKEAFKACVTAARDRGHELGKEALAKLKKG
jgi:pyrroline-5-carboxylate reductase